MRVEPEHEEPPPPRLGPRGHRRHGARRHQVIAAHVERDALGRGSGVDRVEPVARGLEVAQVVEPVRLRLG